MNIEMIQAEIKTATDEREAFIRSAERQIAVFDGALAALNRLLSMACDAAAPAANVPGATEPAKPTTTGQPVNGTAQPRRPQPA